MSLLLLFASNLWIKTKSGSSAFFPPKFSFCRAWVRKLFPTNFSLIFDTRGRFNEPVAICKIQLQAFFGSQFWLFNQTQIYHQILSNQNFVLQVDECFIRSAPGGENIFLKTWFLHLPQQPGTNTMNCCCLVNTITSVFQLATKPLKRKETDLFVFLSHLAISSKHSTCRTPNVTHVVIIKL